MVKSKLNNKGYMLVEIVLASVIAFGVAFSVVNLTVKLKNKNDDLLVETQIATDQAIITNKLMKIVSNEKDNFDCSNLNKDENNNNVIKYNDEKIDLVNKYTDIGDIKCDHNKNFEEIKIEIPLRVTQIQEKEFDVKIDYKYGIINASFDIGREVNRKMKLLAGNSAATVNDDNNNIKQILKSSEAPDLNNMTADNIVSDSNSKTPIYMWFDDDSGTIYWWSIDDNPSLNKTASAMFYNLHALSNISGLKDFDASTAINMSVMFSNSSTNSSYNKEYLDSLSSLVDLSPISKWDVSNVNVISGIFQFGTRLETLDALSNWNIRNVTDMEQAFNYCINLKSTDGIKNWNTGNVKNMRGLFQHVSSVKNIDLAGWDTSNVTDMSYMFGIGYVSVISEIENINISGWDTSNVIDMSAMFVHQVNLKSLDLRSFNTKQVKYMSNMFAHTNLEKIYVSSTFITDNVSNSEEMFNLNDKEYNLDTGALLRTYAGVNEPKLTGENGTTWDSNHTDKEYARIDRPDEPGYFSS